MSYFDIFPFFEHYYHYNIYANIFISLHHTNGPSRCLLFVINNTSVICKTGKIATIHGSCLIILHTPPTIRANVASSLYTYAMVSALHWYSYYCGLVYRIDMLFRTIHSDFFYSPTLLLKFCVISFSFNSIQLLLWLLLFVASIVSLWSRYCWL